MALVLTGSAVSATIPASAKAQHGPIAYVTNAAENTVMRIDTTTNTVAATIPVGDRPVEVVITPDGTRAYVSNYYDSTVSVIDTATNAVVGTISTGGASPAGMAITPDGTRLYVTNFDSDTISVIDIASGTVVHTISVVSGPAAISITPDGSRAYVAELYTGTVSVIDTSTNTVVGTVTVGTTPVAVAITPDGGHVYVANYDGNSVSVIDTATNLVSDTINTDATPDALVVTPDGGRVYVAQDFNNSVSVIATATNTVTGSVPVGLRPSGIAASPDGLHVYVTNSESNTVSSIDTTSNTVVATIPVGSEPIGVALGRTPSTAGLTASPNPASAGQPVTFTANITCVAEAPTGTVEFFDGSTGLGTAPLSGGTATLTRSSLSIGDHHVTAHYSGDTDCVPSTSNPVTVTITPSTKIATSVSVDATPDPAQVGQRVTLTARVSVAETVHAGSANQRLRQPAPTGDVTFYDGTSVLGTAALVDAIATLRTRSLAAGVHRISAVYGGDASYRGSTSAVVPLVIVPTHRPAHENSALCPGGAGACAYNSSHVRQHIAVTSGNHANHVGAATVRAGHAGRTGRQRRAGR